MTSGEDRHELQDVSMNLDRCSTNDIHANSSGGQGNDQDKPLTISQLSPRKRSAVQPSVSNEKRQAPLPPVLRHSQRSRKRDVGSSMSSSLQSLVASAVSSAPLDLRSTTSGACLEMLDVTVKNEGGRMRGIVAGDKHAKTQHSSKLISTNGCGSSAGLAGSGPSTISEQVVKRPVKIGARNRTRRIIKSSSAVSSGGISRPRSRPRSISNSVSMRADVVCASKRNKHLSQVRTRKGRARDHLSRSGQLDREMDTVEEVQTDTGADKLRRVGTLFAFALSLDTHFSAN